MGKPTLGVCVGQDCSHDARWFDSKYIQVVPNGLPDPCPDFDRTLLPIRIARAQARVQCLATGAGADPSNAEAGPTDFRVMYLAHCTREKGVFEVIEGVRLMNASLVAQGSRLRGRLTVAGGFLRAEEKDELEAAIAKANATEPCVTYVGFVTGEEKQKLLADSDCLCQPTYYAAEGQPVSLLEAMAFGLQIVTTRWRGIPAMLPMEYGGFCEPRDAADVAKRLLESCTREPTILRSHFLKTHAAPHFIERLKEAFLHACTP